MSLFLEMLVMYVDVEANDNINESFSMLYRDISESREVYCIKYNMGGDDSPVQIKGWNKETNSPFKLYTLSSTLVE